MSLIKIGDITIQGFSVKLLSAHFSQFMIENMKIKVEQKPIDLELHNSLFKVLILRNLY